MSDSKLKVDRYASELQLAKRCAELAAEVLRKEYDSGSVTRSAEGRDIKLQADINAESVILAELKQRSSYPVLSEEAGADAQIANSDVRWVVDPLDGTFNFSRRIPLCCVSIALCLGQQPVVGVICDFINRVTYHGAAGIGAWRNDEPMHVSRIDEQSQAVLCTGLPVRRDFSAASLQHLILRMQAYKKVRMLGSAALSLAHVASGSADAYHEDSIHIWDVAAGLALVEAAGGRFILRNTAEYRAEVFASNGRIPASLAFT